MVIPRDLSEIDGICWRDVGADPSYHKSGTRRLPWLFWNHRPEGVALWWNSIMQRSQWTPRDKATQQENKAQNPTLGCLTPGAELFWISMLTSPSLDPRGSQGKQGLTWKLPLLMLTSHSSSAALVTMSAWPRTHTGAESVPVEDIHSQCRFKTRLQSCPDATGKELTAVSHQ